MIEIYMNSENANVESNPNQKTDVPEHRSMGR